MYLYCLFEIYDQRQKTIKALFGQARIYFDVDSIHDMRVEIKRLRALFNLIEWINPAFQAKKELADIRKLFKAAGKLRDNHVQQELAESWTEKRRYELSEYLNDLKRIEKQSRPSFAKASRKFDTGIFTGIWKNIRPALAALPPEQIRAKAEERLRFMVDRLIAYRSKENFLEEDYHEIRILSKETRYTLEIIRRCFAKEESLQDLDDAIRKLHQALGKWHDDDVGLTFLDTFLLDYEGEALYRRSDYLRLIRGLEREKSRLLGDFERAWRAFLKLADRHGLMEKTAPEAAPEDAGEAEADERAANAADLGAESENESKAEAEAKNGNDPAQPDSVEGPESVGDDDV